MSSKLRIISCGEIVGGDCQKEKQCIFHHLRKIINAKQQQKVRFCISHKELNKAEVLITLSNQHYTEENHG